jgi:SAM-dependent methyltransferase
MDVYRDFAYLYMKGDYPRFSERMATLLPPILKKFGAEPRRVLDVACGEGTFAVAMAGRGYGVTGVDNSADMLRLARERARDAGCEIEFVQQDMRALSVGAAYDLATSWFDSLNYLLKMDDLRACFSGVHRALKPGGLFIFDMNTVYGLGVVWQRRPCEVCQDTGEFLEIHRKAYDFETNVATMKITGFLKTGETWVRVDEEHRERGYSLGEIHAALRSCGFDVLATWDNPEDMSDPKPESGRVWVVARRPE